MPISVVCSACKAKLNAPDSAAGKKVKCPKCQGVIVVPAPDAEPDFEVVDEEPAAPPAKKPAVKAKTVAAVDEDEDQDERPAKKKPAKAAVDDDEEEDERPRKKPKPKAVAEDDEDNDERDDDEDRRPKKKKRDSEDDRDDRDEMPRKKKKKRERESEGGVSMARYIISAVVLVILVIVAGAIFYTRWSANKEIEAENERIRAKNAENDSSKLDVKDPTPNPNPNPNPGPRPNPNPNPPGPNTGSGVQVKLRFIYDVVFSANGKWGVLRGIPPVGENGRGPDVLRIWETERGGPQNAKETPVLGNKIVGRGGPIAISPNGDTIAYVEFPNLVFVKTATATVFGQFKIDFASAPASIAFNADGKAVTMLFPSSIITLTTEGKSSTRKVPFGAVLDSTCYHPGLDRVVTFDSHALKRVFKLWHPRSDENTSEVPIQENHFITGHTLSADGKTAAISVSDSAAKYNVRFFDLATGKSTGQLPDDDSPEFSRYTILSLSPDARYFAGVGMGKDSKSTFNSMDLFRVEDKKRLYRVTGQNPDSVRLHTRVPVFSPDGKWFYYVLQDSEVVRVDTESGKEVPFPGATK